MVKNYWTLFYLSLIGTIIFLCIFVLGIIFMKKIFFTKKYGHILLIISSCVLITLIVLCVSKFSLCCKDYQYVKNSTCLEEKAKVIEFMESHFDYDGNGEQSFSKPKFYLIEKNEYIVLNAKNVELGEVYIIRFYPNTKICEIIKKIN